MYNIILTRKKQLGKFDRMKLTYKFASHTFIANIRHVRREAINCDFC